MAMEAVKLFELMLREEGAVPTQLSNLHIVALLAESLAAISPKLSQSELSRLIAVGVLVRHQMASSTSPQWLEHASESSLQSGFPSTEPLH
ncbi:hypothetical protein QU481_14650 [Crenobacter sp. SG2303]|uniref:Uncharacterized protein n=1 Tax=Crenobacter oryzisoli TaxID=3056844 RepID=A0ABT7XQR9_9NEIS|nr:hypothetical protein [Crenobacter sp. SG2303]MDN0076127.1 hypothetical protein [Crenobacter sp. SG2303]